MNTQLGSRSVAAKKLKVGDWILYSNPRYNERVVDVRTTSDGLMKVNHDYGNGGEPATSFYEPEDKVCIC